MLTAAHFDRCVQCLGRIVDAGDEFACSSCGMVTPKEVTEVGEDGPRQAIDYTNHSLGRYLAISKGDKL